MQAFKVKTDFGFFYDAVEQLISNMRQLFLFLLPSFIAFSSIVFIESIYPLYGRKALVYTASYMWLYTLLSITLYRFFIQGEGSIPRWGIWYAGKREAYFFLYLVCFYIVLLFASFCIFIPFIGAVMAIVMILYLSLRLLLLFPAIANDQYWRLVHSWRATKKHQLKMFMIVLVILFAFVLSIFLMPFINNRYLSLLIWLFMQVFIISLISQVFKKIDLSSAK